MRSADGENGFSMEVGPYVSFANRNGVSAVFSGEVSSWPGVDMVQITHDGALPALRSINPARPSKDDSEEVPGSVSLSQTPGDLPHFLSLPLSLRLCHEHSLIGFARRPPRYALLFCPRLTLWVSCAYQRLCAERPRAPTTTTPPGCSTSTPRLLKTSTPMHPTMLCQRFRRSRAASVCAQA